jgi:hypothetical protein
MAVSGLARPQGVRRAAVCYPFLCPTPYAYGENQHFADPLRSQVCSFRSKTYELTSCLTSYLLSTAPLVAADYGFTCPPRFMSVCCVLSLFGTDENGHFSPVRSPIVLKFGGDFGLVSQIGVHVLVSRFDCFSHCKQTNKQKNAEIAKFMVLKNLSFLCHSKSD